MKTKTKNYVWSILITLAVGGLAAFFTRNSMNIYESINKPAFAPPGFLFPVVWGILYTLMGFSVANVITKGMEEGAYTLPCIVVYVLQLVVNFFWSIIFFNLRNFLLSFIWLLLLWVLIILMIKCFSKISPLAAYINVPYFLWVTFAAYLNFMIYTLN